MEGLWQFADLRGGIAEKEGVVFLRGGEGDGGGDTPMHTMYRSRSKHNSSRLCYHIVQKFWGCIVYTSNGSPFNHHFMNRGVLKRLKNLNIVTYSSKNGSFLFWFYFSITFSMVQNFMMNNLMSFGAASCYTMESGKNHRKTNNPWVMVSHLCPLQYLFLNILVAHNDQRIARLYILTYVFGAT